jgi:hypothetical protein
MFKISYLTANTFQDMFTSDCLTLELQIEGKGECARSISSEP